MSSCKKVRVRTLAPPADHRPANHVSRDLSVCNAPSAKRSRTISPVPPLEEAPAASTNLNIFTKVMSSLGSFIGAAAEPGHSSSGNGSPAGGNMDQTSDTNGGDTRGNNGNDAPPFSLPSNECETSDQGGGSSPSKT